MWKSWRQGLWTTSTNPSFWAISVQQLTHLACEVGRSTTCWIHILTRICRGTSSKEEVGLSEDECTGPRQYDLLLINLAPTWTQMCWNVDSCVACGLFQYPVTQILICCATSREVRTPYLAGSHVHPQFYSVPSNKTADDCCCPLAIARVQAVNDKDAFDFRVVHAILYFVEYQWRMEFNACWLIDYHKQQLAHSLNHPRLFYYDQHERLALMYQLLLQCYALLEINMSGCLHPGYQSWYSPAAANALRYKNHRWNAYQCIQNSRALPFSALLIAYDTAHNENDKLAGIRITSKQAECGVCFVRCRGSDTWLTMTDFH